MDYQWDELKNEINIKRHGIDFRDIPSFFDNPIIVNVDDRFDYAETRLIGIGWLKNSVVVVVFVEIGIDIIRIISARKANKNERKRFEQEIKNRLG